MSLSRSSLFSRLSIFAQVWVAGLCSYASIAAEEELTLLTIEGDLVGRIESLDQESDAAQIINTYHKLLPLEVQIEVDSLHNQLSQLVPDYEVAFAAADSAELANVMDDIDTRWAAIQVIHTREYTQEVIDLLNESYGKLFPFN